MWGITCSLIRCILHTLCPSTMGEQQLQNSFWFTFKWITYGKKLKKTLQLVAAGITYIAICAAGITYSCQVHTLSPCTMGEQLRSSQILDCKIIYCLLSIQAWLTAYFFTISLKLHWAHNDLCCRMYYHFWDFCEFGPRDTFGWNPHFSHKMKDFFCRERTFLVWEISRFTNGNCQAHLILMIHLIFYLLRENSLGGLKWNLYSTLEEVQPWNKVEMGFLLDNRFSFNKRLPK